MALSFTANVLNNKRKVGHACNSPFNSEKVTRKLVCLVEKMNGLDEDGGYHLTTFLPPMM